MLDRLHTVTLSLLRRAASHLPPEATTAAHHPQRHVVARRWFSIG